MNEATELLHQPGEINAQLLERARGYVNTYPCIKLLTECSPDAITPVSPKSIGNNPARHIFPEVTNDMDLVEPARTLAALNALDSTLARDYDSFTAEELREREGEERDPKKSKLSRASFDVQYNWTAEWMPDEKAVHRVKTHLAMNDLGKTKLYLEIAARLEGRPVTDHDEALLICLERRGDVRQLKELDAGKLQKFTESLGSFTALPEEDQSIIIEALKLRLNFGQILQGESSARSVEGLAKLKKNLELFRHIMAEFWFDLAGARGHESGRGSKIIDDNLVNNFGMLHDAIKGAEPNATGLDIYRSYLNKRAERLELPFNTPEDVTIARICCMLGLNTPEDAERVNITIRNPDLFGPNASKALVQLFGLSEDAGIASPLAYYAPKLFKNLKAVLEKQQAPDPIAEATLIGGYVFAQVAIRYQQLRSRGLADGNIHDIVVRQLAQMAAVSPEELLSGELVLESAGTSLIAKKIEKPPIQLDGLREMPELTSELPGKGYVYVALGGGADIVGCALLKQAICPAKECLGMVSIRDGIDHNTGRPRIPKNAEDCGGGVYIVREDTHLTDANEQNGPRGRYFEDIAAKENDDSPVLLIMRSPGISLDDQIAYAMSIIRQRNAERGGVSMDSIMAVDMGGDSLIPAREQALSRSGRGPNQDLLALESLERWINNNAIENAFTCILACDVDSKRPPNATQILQAAGAAYHLPTPEEIQNMFAFCEQNELPSTTENRYSKMLPAYIHALRNILTGDTSGRLIDTGLPESVILNPNNPWDPFAFITPTSAAMVFMPIRNHLSAIGSQAT